VCITRTRKITIVTITIATTKTAINPLIKAKKFCEELIPYFPLKRQGAHRKQIKLRGKNKTESKVISQACRKGPCLAMALTLLRFYLALSVSSVFFYCYSQCCLFGPPQRIW
jgi:hypothetical protein